MNTVKSQWYLSGPFCGSRSGGPVGRGTSLGMTTCRWLLVIECSSPNCAGTGGVVTIAVF